MESKLIFDVKINLGTYEEFIERIVNMAKAKPSTYTCVANVHMVIEAQRDASFAEILNEADLVTPDGKPLTWAIKLLHGIDQERVAGMDILPDLISAAEKQAIPVAFYGGSAKLLDKTREFLYRNYPKLLVSCMHSPPFRPLTNDEERLIVDMLNQSGAQLIFVALGCPKQEKWMATMKGQVHASMIGIGGALASLLGVKKRAPIWMQNAGLEWFFRLLQEPNRLFARYTVTNTQFIYRLTKEVLFRERKSL